MSLNDTPFGGPEKFNVVVEIPKNSPYKYEYDEAKQEMILDFVWKNGFVFRYNYGFIPKTRGGDGDRLDAVVLANQALEQATIVKCRAIGTIDMLDRGEEDHKIICVRDGDPAMQTLQDISNLSEQQLQEFRDFYAEVARQKEKEIIIRGFWNKEKTLDLIKNSRTNE